MQTATQLFFDTEIVPTTNLIVGGGAGNDVLQGTAAADTLYGYAGNDQIDGKAGADWMYGGSGNDYYRVDNAGDRTVEFAGEGSDSVVATLNWILSPNVENLSFETTATHPGGYTGQGNELANKISGSSGADALYGWGGNDLIDGGSGFDSLWGGTGDDTYILCGDWDWITEYANEGTDRVRSNLADLYLQENLENLDFFVNLVNGKIEGPSSFIGRGNSGNNEITGWSLNDTLYGGAGDDKLFGLDGNDRLEGGTGNDTLFGGNGADTFGFREANPGCATLIRDFVKDQDRIDLSGIDGHLGKAGDQQLAFSFNGQYVGGGQGSFFVEKKAGPGALLDTIVHVDCDGNGVGDLDIVLRGNSYVALDIGDFGL